MTAPNMKLRAVVSFPAQFNSAGGFTVSKVNGIWSLAPPPGLANQLLYYSLDNFLSALPVTAGGVLNIDDSGVPSVTTTPVIGVPGTVAGTIDLAGATSGTSQIKSSDAASGVLTLPDAIDTLVGKATTDTLTNKTFDTAGTGNVFKFNGTEVSDKTGTGKVVLDTSPTLTTPNLGVAAATSLTATGLVQAGSASSIGIGTDVLLLRDAAAALAQRNGTTAQESRIYNTFTDVSNYERGSLGWTANTNWLTLRSTNAGTGTARGIVLASATSIIAHGGTTSSFPALKRNGAAINFRLADDSGDATVTVKTQVATDNTTNAASTAMVQAAISLVTGGSVSGPASSQDGGSPVFNGTTGKILKDSGFYPTQTQRLTSDLSAVTNTTPSNITGFSFALTSGATYRFRVVLFGNLGTGAIKVSMNGGTVTATTVHWSAVTNTGGGSPTIASLGGFLNTLNGNASATTTTLGAISVGYMTIIEGTVTSTGGSTLIPQICQNSNTASGITVLTGSFMEVQQIP